MKLYNVYFNTYAYRELEQIENYIGSTMMEPAAAAIQIEKLVEACLTLETMPYRFPVVTGIRKRDYDVHKMTVGNYLVFYLVNESESLVMIEHILHARMNWRAILL